jgi:hypothetical protein
LIGASGTGRFELAHPFPGSLQQNLLRQRPLFAQRSIFDYDRAAISCNGLIG